MAVEKNILVRADLQKAKSEFEDLSSIIQRQEQFLADLKLRIVQADASLKDLNFTQRQAREGTIKKLNEELKIESAELKVLKTRANGLNQALRSQNTIRKAGTVKALEFNETLLKNRDISSGLSKITGGLSLQIQQFGKLFVSVGKGIRASTLALSGFQKVLIATGIGALVVLVGTLAANFDKIKAALIGVSSEQKKQLEVARDLVTTQEEQFKNLTGTEESLKRQGKTEREITNLKIEQTNQTITALEAQLEQQKTIKDEQIKIAERNRFILEGILKFVAQPLDAIVKAFNFVTGKDVTLPSKGIASAIFNVDKISEEADAGIKETEKKLQELKNRRDGFLNRIQAKEDADAEKAKNKADKDAQDAIDAETRRLQSIADLRDKYKKLNQDREDQTFLEQAERQKARALAELTALKATEDQKAELIKYYSGVIAEATIKDEESRTNAIEKLEEQKRAIREKTFNTAVQLAGEDSRLGKAILVAKTLLAARENILEVKKTLVAAQQASTQASIDGVKSTSAIAKGTAETAKVGFPQNIPLLIAYAAQAIGIISAVKSAVGKTKQIASSAGGTGIGANIQTPTIPISAPSFNIVGASQENQLASTIAQTTNQPVKAFVVANEVTTAQGLQRNIIEESSLG